MRARWIVECRFLKGHPYDNEEDGHRWGPYMEGFRSESACLAQVYFEREDAKRIAKERGIPARVQFRAKRVLVQ